MSGDRSRGEHALCYSLVLSLWVSHLSLWVSVFSSMKWGFLDVKGLVLRAGSVSRPISRTQLCK